MVQRLLPHIQQFVRVRQALLRASARSSTVTALLDNPRIGVLELDRRGRIMEGNPRARSILRHGDRLLDRNGMLRVRRADQGPSRTAGGRRVAGLWRGRCQWVDGAPPLVRGAAVRGARQAGGRPSTGPRSAARCRAGADCRAGATSIASIPTWWPTTLELTPAETKVAVWLAEGP